MRTFLLCLFSFFPFGILGADIVVDTPHDPRCLNDEIVAADLPALRSSKDASGFSNPTWKMETEKGVTVITVPDEAEKAVRDIIHAHDKAQIDDAKTRAAEKAVEEKNLATSAWGRLQTESDPTAQADFVIVLKYLDSGGKLADLKAK